MKLVSNVALALMLSLGATVIVAEPAVAQKSKKDDKAEAGPKLSATPAFAKAAGPVEAALKAKDFATAETQLATAEPLAKTDDDRYFVGQFRLTIASGKNDKVATAQALDALLTNPKTPTADLIVYNNVRGSLALEQKQNPQAITYLLKARELGYTGSDLPVSLAQAYGADGKINEAVAELDKAMKIETAAGRKPPESWYNFAVTNLFASHDLTNGTAWLIRQLHDYPSTATWNTAINNYRKVVDPNTTTFTKAQKLDLFRMMRGTKVLTDTNDYFRYASAAQDSGLPWEAVSVVDAGRTAGKIPAGDADFTRIYTASKDSITREGSIAAYEKRAVGAPNGAKALEAADINLAAGEYAKAATLYGTAITGGGINANEANLRLGYALVNLGRKDEAKAAFAKVTGAPLADIAHFWTIWLDMPPLA